MIRLDKLFNTADDTLRNDVWYNGERHRITSVTFVNVTKPYLRLEMHTKPLSKRVTVEGYVPDILAKLSLYPDLKVDQKVLVWEDPARKMPCHFSHFGNDGFIRVFSDGKTSFTVGKGDLTTMGWHNYEVVEE